MGIWQDMQERWRAELASFEKLGGSKKNQYKKLPDVDAEREEDEEDEDEDEDACTPSTFAESKVRELCPEIFPGHASKQWAVLLYNPAAASKKASVVGRVWRALAGTVPADVKVGAVDCSAHARLCEKHGAAPKKLPMIARFVAGEAQAVYEGEPTLEDLAVWVVKPPKTSKVDL